MMLPSTRQLVRAAGQLLLFASVLSVLAAATVYPEARLPIVIWLLAVVLAHRPSPGERR